MFVNNDLEMVDAQGQHAKARNTNLNEDLGKVCYSYRRFQRTDTPLTIMLRRVADVGGGST